MTVNMGQRTPDTPGPVVPFFYPCMARPESEMVAHKKRPAGSRPIGEDHGAGSTRARGHIHSPRVEHYGERV